MNARWSKAPPLASNEDLGGVPLDEGPVEPPHQSVDGVVPTDLVQRRLTMAAAILVVTVGQSVGPGCEHLSPAIGGAPADVEAVDHVQGADSVLAKGRTDLGDDRRVGRDLAVVGPDRR